MQRIKIRKLWQDAKEQKGITIAGWVRTRRDSKTLSFIEINDGSTVRNVQVIAESSLANYEEVKKLTLGCSIKVTGDFVSSPAKGQPFEIKATEVVVLGWADPEEFPLQKKEMTLEYLREQAYLRARTTMFGSLFRVRNACAFAVHKFFQEREFFYVHTPVITASDCEGAGQMFQVTTLDLDKLPRDKQGKIDYSQDFFGKRAYLTVSGQLEGETFATALGDIYTFGPTFRAEKSNTPRHASEFWMIEPEMAFYELEDNMVLAEDFVKYVVAFLMREFPEELEYFDKNVEEGLLQRLKVVLESPFKRVSYTEAVSILEKSGRQFEYKVSWGIDLQSEHERYLTEEHFKCPIIVYNYPKEIKSFYMKQNEDGKTVRAMDVLVPKIGEIIGGSQREDDHGKLLARIKELGMEEKDYWWYLNLRRFGSVPHSGFGLGFERLIMFITGMKNIRDVLPYARTPGNAEF